jgi:hypothetical protein
MTEDGRPQQSSSRRTRPSHRLRALSGGPGKRRAMSGLPQKADEMTAWCCVVFGGAAQSKPLLEWVGHANRGWRDGIGWLRRARPAPIMKILQLGFSKRNQLTALQMSTIPRRVRRTRQHCASTISRNPRELALRSETNFGFERFPPIKKLPTGGTFLMGTCHATRRDVRARDVGYVLSAAMVTFAWLELGMRPAN